MASDLKMCAVLRIDCLTKLLKIVCYFIFLIRIPQVASATEGLHATEVPALPASLENPDLETGMLESHMTNYAAAVATAEEVLHKGNELSVAFDSVGVNFPSGSFLLKNSFVPLNLCYLSKAGFN